MTIGRGLLEYTSQFGTPAVWRLQWGSQLPNLFFELHFSHLVKKWHDLQKWGSNSNMSLVFWCFPYMAGVVSGWNLLLRPLYHHTCTATRDLFCPDLLWSSNTQILEPCHGECPSFTIHRLQPKVLCSRVLPTKRSVWVMRIFWPPVKPVENFLSHSSSKACCRFKTITGTLAPSHFNRKSRKAASRRLSRE